jgi:hypothetical protein
MSLVVSSAYNNFISGPTPQSTNNNWQYFEVNQDRSSATLLSSWQNGNEVIYTYGQWDNNRVSGNYPFIQKVTGSGTINGNYGSSFTGPALVMHPDDSSIYNICIGYKNTTVNTITATVDISLSLLHPDRNFDGINYYIQRGLVNGSRYSSYVNSSIPQGSTSTYTFTNSSIELRAGELIYLIINRNSSFGWDYTRVGFTVTYTGAVEKISPTYNTIPQVSKTIGVDASFSLTNVMIGASNSDGAYTFSSTSTAISISGGVATILEYTPSAAIVNASQASTATYNAGSTTFNLLISRRTSTFSTSTFAVASSKTAVDPSFAITTRPTSDSSGAITYTSSNPGVATIDASGNWINIVSVGDVSFNALQAETNLYLSATKTSNTLTVSLGTPSIITSFAVAEGKAYGDASFSILTRPTTNSSGAITYSSNNMAVATIDTSGNWINLVGAGNVTFTALQAAVPNRFISRTLISNTLTVSLGTPTLSSATFTVTNTSKAYGDPSFAILTRPTSNSSGAITYTSDNSGVATIDTSGNWINIVGVGNVSFNASQAAVPNQFISGSRTSGSLTISKGTPTLAFVSPPSTKVVTDASFSVSATSASDGAVSYSSSDISLATVHSSTGSVTLKGIGSVTITASQVLTSLYNAPANATCSISIGPAGTSLQGDNVTPGTSYAGVDLSGASLVGTTVSGVSFSGANLRNVDFSGAVIVGTDFTNANINGATNLPAFSTIQKLQLLKNINNIGQVQVTGSLSGTIINSLVDIPSDIINNATFVVKAPASMDGSGNKIVTVSVPDISGGLSVYIPLNVNERAKINNVVYLFDGNNILDASGSIVNFITISGVPFKVYAGSIVAVNIINVFNKVVISFPDGLNIGLYELIKELFELK